MILMEFTSRSPRATILFVKYLTLEYILGSIGSTHGIFDNVELQCSHGSLAVAHVGILLTDYSQQSCLEYISDPQHITDELRRYCDIHGTKARCTFKLADILGHEPDPACLDNYDVISICQTF
ncbi:uncharacterized protein LOC119718835 isoform X2 [Patiria miniata]|uniref:Uncharacterized protein n=1 Tax=Patiria miniata TaxID=46514 RepID=A0A913YXB9_PATMI|nr:uncharacterized protein LOC119718835 isoform X2 [Patiria miniata]